MILYGASNMRLLLFDDNKIKMARKPGKIWKENPVGCTREDKKKIREDHRKFKMETACI